MPGSKCQIVVLAGKTGHFTDIIKNKKRGGKQMNKTPKINRLFLVTVIWILLSGIFLGFIPFVRSMDDAGYWIYDHKQGRPEKVDAI